MSEKSEFGIAAKTLTCIVLAPIMVLSYGWAAQTLWNWYMPAIFGLPNLTFGAALGVGLVAGFFCTKLPTNDMETKWAIFCVIRPFTAVLVGWIYLQIWPVS